jgi:hypothetical protein
MRYLLSLIFAVMLLGCPLHDPVNVEPDYPSGYPPGNEIVPEYADGSAQALASPCGQACKRISELSCPEGKPNAAGWSCYRVCVKATRLRRLPVACWTAAPDVSALRACGALRCLP